MIVTLDTVRADRLHLYGHEVATSPALDELARRADVYERAWATAPWTLPSHASLFTGLPPFEHGAHSYRAKRKGLNAAPLPPSAVTLAEFLLGLGYRTAGFVANRVFLAPRFQLDQGFTTWVVHAVPGVELDRSVAHWLDDQASGAPFFLFVNFMDAHRPYNLEPVPGLPPPPPDDPSSLLDTLLQQVMGTDDPIDPKLLGRVLAQYDNGVANADRALGELLRELDEHGVLDDALVVVASDHGEYLGEHRLVEHSKDVYEPALRIPLLVKRPGQREGRRLAQPISIADVPALVMRELSDAAASAPPAFRVPPASRPILAENHYTRAKDLSNPLWGHRFQRVRSVLYQWPYKYIRSSDGRDELYDLGSDPDEVHDLHASDAERGAAMRTALDALVPVRDLMAPRRKFGGRHAAPELSPEEREAMRALGYLD